MTSQALWGRLCATRPGAAPVVLRIALAVTLWPHGLQKMFGWFGGFGFTRSIEIMGTMGVAAPLGRLAIVTEFVGPVALFVGAGTRLAAFAIAILFAVAGSLHLEHGFFMNWFGWKDGEGFEYHILALAMSVALVIRGGGSVSLDRRWNPSDS